MDTATWILIALVFGTMCSMAIIIFFEIRYIEKIVDKIDRRSESLNMIAENAKKSAELLAEQVVPQLDQISKRNDKIDFIASEIEYQRRKNLR